MAKDLFEAFNITTQGLKDFQACELYYSLEHKEQRELQSEIYTHEKLLAQRYEEILRKIAFFYFHRKQGGLTPSFDSIIRRWERLWFPDDMDAYDMSTSQQSVRKTNLKDYSNMALAAIEAFYDEFDSDLSIPISIDEDVFVPAARHLRLVARPDVVLYSREEESFRVIHLIATRRNKSLGKYQIDLAMNRLAFEHHHDAEEAANATYHIYNLGNPKTGFHKMAQPSEEHMVACLYWANEITKKENFVPRRGFSSYCKGCKFDSQCLNYKWKDIDNVE